MYLVRYPTQVSVLTRVHQYSGKSGGGGGGGFRGLQPTQKFRAIQNALSLCLARKHIAMSMVFVVVSSEQVVKPRSRQVVVKPGVLHLLGCQLLVQRESIKMGVVLIKWAWLKSFARMLRH